MYSKVGGGGSRKGGQCVWHAFNNTLDIGTSFLVGTVIDIKEYYSFVIDCYLIDIYQLVNWLMEFHRLKNICINPQANYIYQ